MASEGNALRRRRRRPSSTEIQILPDSDEEYTSFEPMRRSYLAFLNLMKPVFANVYQGVAAHVIWPLAGAILLFMLVIMTRKFKATWQSVEGFITPFLWITFACQSIRYLFFLHNAYIGTERVPTTREICSIATYFFSTLRYLPHFAITVTLAHSIASLHIRPLTARELLYGQAGMLLLFLLANALHFRSKTLEMAWICRPYRFNNTVLTILHYLLTGCTVVNPFAAAYLYWAQRYQVEIDKEAKQSMVIFFFLVSTYGLVRIALKWGIELSIGYWAYVKNFILIDEAVLSLYFCIVLTLLILSFSEFRKQTWEWIKFTRKPKLPVPERIAI